MFKLLRKKPVLYLWIVMFFAVLFINIVTNCIILARVKINLSTETENKNGYVLKCIQKSCDSMFTDTKRYSEILQENASLKRLAELNLSSNARYEAGMLADYIAQSSIDSIYLNDVYVYFNKNGLVVNSGGVRDSHNFYENHIKDEFINHDEWLNKISNHNSTYGAYTENKINFYTVTDKYVICISVDKKSVMQEVFMAESDDIILVVNSRDKIIYKWGEFEKEDEISEIIEAASEGYELEIDGTRMMGMIKKSLVSRYKYIYLSPLSIQKRVISDTLVMGFGFSFLCILLMAVLFGLLIFWNYRQINNLVKTTDSDADNDEKNEFNIINNSILNYKKQIRRFEIQSRKNVDLLRQNVVADILRGSDADYKKSNFRFTKNQIYGVVIIGIDDYGIISDDGKRTQTFEEEARFIIKNVMADLLGSYKIEWTVMEGRLVGIFISEAPIYENYKNILSDILMKASDALSKHLEMQLSFYASEPVSDIENCSELYEQAEKALEFGKFYGLSDVFYEDITDADSKFPNISHSLENALTTAIKSGNKEEASSVLDRILDKHLISKPVSKRYINSFVAILIHIIRGASDKEHFEFEEKWENTKKLSDVRMVAKCMKYALDGAMQSEENNPEFDIAEQIVKYIDENFTDSDLCVNSIGDSFDMSAQYISRLFRKKYGFRIVDYIHKLRINYAKKILETDSQAKIDDIAQIVGYGTSRAFMMRFKEREGITPTQYKSNIKRS